MWKDQSKDWSFFVVCSNYINLFTVTAAKVSIRSEWIRKRGIWRRRCLAWSGVSAPEPLTHPLRRKLSESVPAVDHSGQMRIVIPDSVKLHIEARKVGLI